MNKKNQHRNKTDISKEILNIEKRHLNPLTPRSPRFSFEFRAL